jgi:hypothetical protein
MMDIPAIKARYEADGPHVQNGAFCQGCLCVWPCGGSFLAALVTALEEAEKTLGAIREAAALAPSLPASTILDILGESE